MCWVSRGREIFGGWALYMHEGARESGKQEATAVAAHHGAESGVGRARHSASTAAQSRGGKVEEPGTESKSLQMKASSPRFVMSRLLAVIPTLQLRTEERRRRRARRRPSSLRGRFISLRADEVRGPRPVRT